MQKKLIAAAVAGALGLPAVALAQNATVNIYGRMYVEWGQVNQGQNAPVGAAAPTTDRVNTDLLQAPGSMIGFRGEEKLGGGTSAWFQCESSADPRGINQDGFCSRNSAVGLKGAFGNVFVGNWHTPFARARIFTGSNETGLWGTSGLLTGHSTTAADGAAPQLFARRQSNSINYDSPNFSGFQVLVSTTSANTGTARTNNAVNDKPRVWSFAGMYNNGPLAITAAYEQHKKFTTNGLVFPALAVAGDESGWLIGASYRFANQLTLGGMYTRQQWDTFGGGLPVGAKGESKVNAWQIGVDWTISGPHSIKASYTRAGDVTGTGAATPGGLRPAAVPGGSTGAKMYGARYQYNLSKRTFVGAGFQHVKNDTFAGYNINGVGGNGGAGGGNGLGGKHTGYGVYVDHRW